MAWPSKDAESYHRPNRRATSIVLLPCAVIVGVVAVVLGNYLTAVAMVFAAANAGLYLRQGH